MTNRLRRLILFLVAASAAYALNQHGRGAMLINRIIRPILPLSQRIVPPPAYYNSYYAHLMNDFEPVCSGVVVSNYFITANHCAEAVGHTKQGEKGRIRLTSDDFSNSKTYETVLEKVYDDVAIYRISEFKNPFDRTVLGGAETLRRGSTVYIALGGFGVISEQGTPYYIVRSYRVIGVYDTHNIGVSWYKGKVLLLEGGSFGGCSGSPCYDEEGRLIGILIGGVADFTIVCPLKGAIS